MMHQIHYSRGLVPRVHIASDAYPIWRNRVHALKDMFPFANNRVQVSIAGLNTICGGIECFFPQDVHSYMPGCVRMKKMYERKPATTAVVNFRQAIIAVCEDAV